MNGHLYYEQTIARNNTPMKGVRTVELTDLTREQREFLDTLPIPDSEENGTCLFVRKVDTFKFVHDYKLSAKTKAIKAFEPKANSLGLYRGGAIILVLTKAGIIVVPDERYNWFKPFAGISRYDEGDDLTKTMRRELIEEAFIRDTQFSGDQISRHLDKTNVRYVPSGVAQAELTNSLGLTCDSLLHVGHVEEIGTAINEKNSAYESVGLWDLSQLPMNSFFVTLEEKWFLGGGAGISVFTMNSKGAITGVFSGQQGFLEVPKFGIHESLKTYLYK